MNIKQNSKLSKNQILAARLLAKGKRDYIIAKKLGIEYKVLLRWQQKPEFKNKLDEELLKIKREVKQRLECLMLPAMDRIEMGFYEGVDKTLATNIKILAISLCDTKLPMIEPREEC